MEIKNTNKEELNHALNFINNKYNNNIEFMKLEPLNKKETRFRIRLKVKDSKKEGSARAFLTNRRLISACWHAHGYFFEELINCNPTIEIKAKSLKINSKGGNWDDKLLGNVYIGQAYQSDCCEC